MADTLDEDRELLRYGYGVYHVQVRGTVVLSSKKAETYCGRRILARWIHAENARGLIAESQRPGVHWCQQCLRRLPQPASQPPISGRQ